jgi:hypothetical protein
MARPLVWATEDRDRLSAMSPRLRRIVGYYLTLYSNLQQAM